MSVDFKILRQSMAVAVLLLTAAALVVLICALPFITWSAYGMSWSFILSVLLFVFVLLTATAW